MKNVMCEKVDADIAMMTAFRKQIAHTPTGILAHSFCYTLYRSTTVRYHSQAEVAAPAASSSISASQLYYSTTAIVNVYRTLSL